eukprot:403331917
MPPDVSRFRKDRINMDFNQHSQTNGSNNNHHNYDTNHRHGNHPNQYEKNHKQHDKNHRSRSNSSSDVNHRKRDSDSDDNQTAKKHNRSGKSLQLNGSYKDKSHNRDDKDDRNKSQKHMKNRKDDQSSESEEEKVKQSTKQRKSKTKDQSDDDSQDEHRKHPQSNKKLNHKSQKDSDDDNLKSKKLNGSLKEQKSAQKLPKATLHDKDSDDDNDKLNRSQKQKSKLKTDKHETPNHKQSTSKNRKSDSEEEEKKHLKSKKHEDAKHKSQDKTHSNKDNDHLNPSAHKSSSKMNKDKNDKDNTPQHKNNSKDNKDHTPNHSKNHISSHKKTPQNQFDKDGDGHIDFEEYQDMQKVKSTKKYQNQQYVANLYKGKRGDEEEVKEKHVLSHMNKKENDKHEKPGDKQKSTKSLDKSKDKIHDRDHSSSTKQIKEGKDKHHPTPHHKKSINNKDSDEELDFKDYAALQKKKLTKEYQNKQHINNLAKNKQDDSDNDDRKRNKSISHNDHHSKTSQHTTLNSKHNTNKSLPRQDSSSLTPMKSIMKKQSKYEKDASSKSKRKMPEKDQFAEDYSSISSKSSKSSSSKSSDSDTDRSKSKGVRFQMDNGLNNSQETTNFEQYLHSQSDEFQRQEHDKDQQILKLEEQNRVIESHIRKVETQLTTLNTVIDKIKGPKYKPKSHRYDLNPEDSQLASWVDKINVTQNIIADQKRDIERLKNSLTIVENGNSKIEMENKLKATELQIEQLDHQRRGYENTIENQNQEIYHQNLDRKKYDNMQSLKDELEMIKRKYKNLKNVVEQNTAVADEDHRKEVLRIHYLNLQLKLQLTNLKNYDPTKTQDKAQSPRTVMWGHISTLRTKYSNEYQQYEKKIGNFDKHIRQVFTQINEKDKEVRNINYENMLLLSELETLKKEVAKLPKQTINGKMALNNYMTDSTNLDVNKKVQKHLNKYNDAAANLQGGVDSRNYKQKLRDRVNMSIDPSSKNSSSIFGKDGVNTRNALHLRNSSLAMDVIPNHKVIKKENPYNLREVNKSVQHLRKSQIGANDNKMPSLFDKRNNSLAMDLTNSQKTGKKDRYDKKQSKSRSGSESSSSSESSDSSDKKSSAKRSDLESSKYSQFGTIQHQSKKVKDIEISRNQINSQKHTLNPKSQYLQNGSASNQNKNIPKKAVNKLPSIQSSYIDMD